MNATNYNNDNYYPEVVDFLTNSGGGLDSVSKCMPGLEDSMPEGGDCPATPWQEGGG